MQRPAEAAQSDYRDASCAPSDRARLERRPEATAHQVDDLLAKVRAGQLRLPDSQRKLTWQPRDMLDPFDSLYRGFPIGTLLLRKRQAGAGTITFGELSIEAAASRDCRGQGFSGPCEPRGQSLVASPDDQDDDGGDDE